MSVTSNRLELEKAVIGACLWKDSLFDTAVSLGVTADWFSGTDELKIWEAMQRLRERRCKIDFVLLEAETGIINFNQTEYCSSASKSGITGYIKALCEAIRLDRLDIGIVNLHNDLTSKKWSSEKIIERLTWEIGNLVQVHEHKDSTPRDIWEAIQAYQRGEITAPDTGLERMNEFPVFSPSLVVLAARPSMGKTSIALHLAERFIEQNLGVGFYSLEQTELQLQMRRVSMRSGIRVVDMKLAQTLNEYHMTQIAEALGALEKRVMHIAHDVWSWPQLEAKIRNDVANRELKIIFIDYLGLIKTSDRNRVQEVGAIARGCANLSKELNITIWLLHQLNREVERYERKDKRPVLSDLRDSGEIEQHADAVWMLYRDCVYNSDSDKDKAEILVRKNRDGAVGYSEVTVSLRCGAWGYEARKRIGK